MQARTGPDAGSQSTRLTKDLDLVEDKSVSCDLGDLEFTGAWEKSKHEVTEGSYNLTRYLQYIILDLDSRSIWMIHRYPQIYRDLVSQSI